MYHSGNGLPAGIREGASSPTAIRRIPDHAALGNGKRHQDSHDEPSECWTLAGLDGPAGQPMRDPEESN
jgi:hypothetical protein